ncbi:sensor histidine kinase [Aureibacter tunicatorum]|uniref:LytS/YehU family sensor histidine kinase n=1 Tax=Aureibacter tunicatorum TaxID=866807 RepID=A0AAE4BS28_9BACT|nr:histidine kinase [Aureibacter tunicatorum]MDR6237912.1 LytS/YehU family sensor histidine kinase [Aureibacter tunicatorum]BDD02945.1 hypothetical protein AUTU_04280 [Aureibacter tunicatorum]
MTRNEADYYKTELFFVSITYVFYTFSMLVSSFAIHYYTRYKDAEAEKIKSELSVLKSQINPHFFFNTLNIIYSQAITKSDKTVESISKLSSMMRYVLSDTQESRVSLAQEIKYYDDYIALQKERLTEKTNVVFKVEGKITNQFLPPLLGINLIENAFKFGVSTEKETSIIIHIIIDNQWIEFDISNDIPKKKAINSDSSQIGLANTKKRLDLLFVNKYTLQIEKNDLKYSVLLKFPLSC